MRHRAASAELELEGQYLGYKLGPMPCYYCSTTEGEPELCTLRSTSNTALLQYTSSAGLVFQSWLKDIHIHVQDRRLIQREAIQLVKDFTMECAQDEVEFYMGMVMEEDQSFEGLVEHLQDAFQYGKTLSELFSNFYTGLRRPERLSTPLLMIHRCWQEK